MAAFFIGKARLITSLFSSCIPNSAYLLILKRPPTHTPNVVNLTTQPQRVRTPVSSAPVRLGSMQSKTPMGV